MATPARWRVHLPTADQTCVRLALPHPGERDPWPLARVLAELASLGARPIERTRALGAGRGVPVLASTELCWHGCPLAVESFHDVRGGAGELAVSAPSWDELATRLPGEDAFWELIDTAAAAAGARYGAVLDGEALEADEPAGVEAWEAMLRRHLGVLARPGSFEVRPALAARYRELPLSGLSVLLR
jgi:hypothetical protein